MLPISLVLSYFIINVPYTLLHSQFNYFIGFICIMCLLCNHSVESGLLLDSITMYKLLNVLKSKNYTP